VYVSRKAGLKHLRAVEGSHYVLEPPPTVPDIILTDHSIFIFFPFVIHNI